MEKIVILGGGMGGFYAAQGLSKSLEPDQAQIILVDMRPVLVYQPFLAEVVSGAIKPKSVETPLAENLPGVTFVQATVTGISNAEKKVMAVNPDGIDITIPYDQLVVALGAVTRFLPIPGIAEHAIGMKSAEEADYVRNELIGNIKKAAAYPKNSAERKRLLTFIVIGGGFSGIETFAEALSFAQMLARKHGISRDELEFHLIEAMDRIIADLPIERSMKVVEGLEKRGAHVHLNTFCQDATDGVVKTSEGAEYPTGIIVWTAGVMPAPCLKQSDLPLTERGYLRCQADLRVYDDEGVVEGVWGVGDCCQIPDKTGAGLPDGSCAPTAQHSVRQARQLVKNIVASMKGEPTEDYYHENEGMVGGFGFGHGVFINGKKDFGFYGLLASLGHRAYHSYALPSSGSRKQVIGDWLRARNTIVRNLEKPQS